MGGEPKALRSRRRFAWAGEARSAFVEGAARSDMVEKLALLLLGVPLAIALLPRWRQLIWGVMVLFVYEGALRKWVLPGLQAELYLLKDAVLLLAYAGFLLHRPANLNLPQRVARPVGGLFVVLALFLFAQLFNPNAPSAVLSVIGYKNYLIYVPLCFIVPSMISDVQQVDKLLRRYVILMIPAIGISYIQFAMPSTHWINSYVVQYEGARSAAAEFGISRLARTAGTFSYIGGNFTFLSFIWLISLGQIMARGAKVKGNRLWIFVFVLSTGALFTTGSRSGLVMIAGSAAFFAVFAAWRGMISAKLLARLSIMGAVVVLAVGAVAGAQFDALLSRTENTTDTAVRLVSPIVEMVNAFRGTGLIGTGMATTHGSARAILGTDTDYGWLHGVETEVETARVMLEIGPFGFVLVYLLRIIFVGFALSYALRSRSQYLSALSGCLAIWFMVHIVMFVVNNPTAALYYYVGFGMLLAFIAMERNYERYVREVGRVARFAVPFGHRPHAAPG